MIVYRGVEESNFMKNVLPILALMLSVSGIAVSLGREEVRCYIGLTSAACPQETAPETKPDTTEKVQDSLSPSSSENTRNIEPSPSVSPQPSEPSPVLEQTTPTSQSTTAQEEKTETSPALETKDQKKTPTSEVPPDVTPSPESSPQSVPLEVIPPAEP
jgi:hypothetical protein